MKEILGDAVHSDIRALLQELQSEYEEANRGFRLVEIAGGFQLCTTPEVASWLKKLYASKHKEHLSRPALETLAIVAYKQPLVRAEIEFIRGVNVDGVIKVLLERNLIRIVGRRESPGRPILYGTTNEFLQYFGLNSLEDLPRLGEFTEADIKLEVEKLIEKKEERDEESGRGTEGALEDTTESAGTN
jgi:segregation and condensation protein B